MEQTSATRKLGPPDFVSMADRHLPSNAHGTKPRCQQTERSRRSVHDRVTPIPLQDRTRPAHNSGCGQEEVTAITNDGVLQPRVERFLSMLCRRIDHDVVRWHALAQGKHEGFDAPMSGWKVVGHDECSTHSAEPSAGAMLSGSGSRFSFAQVRASAIRCGAVSWLANIV